MSSIPGYLVSNTARNTVSKLTDCLALPKRSNHTHNTDTMNAKQTPKYKMHDDDDSSETISTSKHRDTWPDDDDDDNDDDDSDYDPEDNRSLSSSDDDDSTSDNYSGAMRACCRIFWSTLTVLVSLCVSAFFAFVACLKLNDFPGLHWVIFESFNAIVPVIYLVHFLFDVPRVKVLHGATMIAGVWSILYIVTMVMLVQDETEYTRSRQFIAWIALGSSLYHSFMAL